MISVLTSLVTLVGMYLVSRKDWRGWAVGLANQALWLWLIIDTQAWGLLILTVSLIYIYTRALFAWRGETVLRSVRCADGSLIHDFMGGTRCPSCGFGGVQ